MQIFLLRIGDIKMARGRRFFSACGFTLVEMITVLAVIAVLVSLLIPALGFVRESAKVMRQTAQLNNISIALETYNGDADIDYPPSDNMDDDTPAAYFCGAQKLAEAVVGRDGFGFHPDSLYRSDGEDDLDVPVYDQTAGNIAMRKGPYLELEVANAVKLTDLYNSATVAAVGLNGDTFVLADMFGTVQHKVSRKKTGMPILYYRANASNVLHRPAPSDPAPFNNCVYDQSDNNIIMGLGLPWDSAYTHPLSFVDPFYDFIKNPDFSFPERPYRADSFILISAGPDAKYGTADDVCNFERN